MLIITPGTVYLHILKQPRIIQITASGVTRNYTWSGYFSAMDPSHLNVMNSSIVISQTGQSDSFVNMSLWGNSLFSSKPSFTQFIMYMEVNGALNSGLSLNSLNISENGTVPSTRGSGIEAQMYPVLDKFINASMKSSKSYNYVSNFGDMPALNSSQLSMSATASLQNNTGRVKGVFHFSVYAWFIIDVWTLQQGHPFGMGFSVVAQGLPHSTALHTNIEINELGT